MSVDTNTSVQSRVISAFFDAQGAARKAVDDLVAAGIPREHISEATGTDPGLDTAAVGTEVGWWDQLKHLFLPDDDRGTYSEGLRRGGTLISVRADEANYNRVLDILDTDGAVNMGDREREWKAEGWSSLSGGATAAAGFTGTTAGTVAASAPHTIQPSIPVGPAFGAGSAGSANAKGAERTGAAAPADHDITATALAGKERVSSEDEVTRLYGDAYSVGRRDDDHGRTRVRSYIFDGTAASADAPRTSAAPAAIDASQIVEHMDVISADGQKIGEVDHLDGPERIKLSKNSSPDGQHHFVPFTWIDHIDQHVHLKKTLAEIKSGR